MAADVETVRNSSQNHRSQFRINGFVHPIYVFDKGG